VGADLQMILDAVASPVRREILWLTWDGERSVGDLGAHFDISGPTLSSHLATLRDAGLVTVRVDGNFRRYRCNHDAVRSLIPLLASNDDRWVVADDIPERDRATSAHCVAVRVEVDVSLDQRDAFAAFVDGDRYSQWLGVPVKIRDRRFSATLEWGTQVRGTYEVISPPDLIAMRWDFDDDAIPLPGRGLIAYLRVHPTRRGSRVEIQQLADDAAQAEFLTAAWSMVLGRFVDAHTASGTRGTSPRPPRPKRRPST
jgi:DNA-binding transcriptional ArsR family regulator